MSGHSLNPKKRYSARTLAVGAVFCPSCGRRLADRDSDRCPACGFVGEDTMKMFRAVAPPLEVISDHARLFSENDKIRILKSIRKIRRAFPQIHWRIATADLQGNDDVGLFSFWLLNVSPLGQDEEPDLRPWTVLLVILADGDLSVTPGYAAEVWLSGHDWSRLLSDLHGELRQRNFSRGIGRFLSDGGRILENAWRIVKRRTQNNGNTRDRS
jgi:hypothetical protein